VVGEFVASSHAVQEASIADADFAASTPATSNASRRRSCNFSGSLSGGFLWLGIIQ